jgi:hypothetical protein
MTFLLSVFFINPLLLVLIDTVRSNFDVYKIFVELFIFESDFLLYYNTGELI